jgi:cytoskeletal protein CcmA (bactofilin family)
VILADEFLDLGRPHALRQGLRRLALPGRLWREQIHDFMLAQLAGLVVGQIIVSGATKLCAKINSNDETLMITGNDRENPSFIHGATPRTVLFANSSISGKLSYNLPVKIDGHFTGEIKSTELLVIGANAQVDAHISARQVHLEGRLVGSVQSMGCFEVMPGGYFKGEARVAELRVHPGAIFDGNGNVLGG